ncbi:cytochrome C, partial [Burkholderia sp. Ac-20353]|nr:cytochrome C [Burkholderia sp. Ac-20353]
MAAASHDAAAAGAAGLAADASQARRAHYAWPIGEAHASLDVESRTAPDGRMTTWRYCAQVKRAIGDGGMQPALADGGAQATPATPTFVYRHAHASIEMTDPARAIPPHAHVFARESFIDELAGAMRRDPVALRLQHLDPAQDAGPCEIIRMVTQRAAWGEAAAVGDTNAS